MRRRPIDDRREINVAKLAADVRADRTVLRLTPPAGGQPTGLEVRLARWESALGLLRSIRVPRADLSEVQVVEDPLAEVMRAGIKVGLRLPWLLYIARTIGLDRAFIVRRGVPG